MGFFSDLVSAAVDGYKEGQGNQRRNERNDDARYEKAIQYAENGDYASAHEMAESMVDWEYKKTLWFQISMTFSSAAYRYVNEGDIDKARGSINAAQMAASNANEDTPWCQILSTYRLLGEKYKEMGDLKSAKEILTHGLSIVSTSASSSSGSLGFTQYQIVEDMVKIAENNFDYDYKQAFEMLYSAGYQCNNIEAINSRDMALFKVQGTALNQAIKQANNGNFENALYLADYAADLASGINFETIEEKISLLECIEMEKECYELIAMSSREEEINRLDNSTNYLEQAANAASQIDGYMVGEDHKSSVLFEIVKKQVQIASKQLALGAAEQASLTLDQAKDTVIHISDNNKRSIAISEIEKLY
nr:hypothetical protein [uncultured Methanolobus sp.]